MIVDKIRTYVNDQLSTDEKSKCNIYGLWDITCLFNPNNERYFNYNFLIAKTIGQGCAYLTKKPRRTYLEHIIGKNYFDLNNIDLGIEVAILDSIIEHVGHKPSKSYELKGSSLQKSIERAEIVVSLAETFLKNCTIEKEYDVINIGVVNNFLKLLFEKKYKIIGSDFDKRIIDKKLFSEIDIIDGNRTIEYVKKSKLAIITGMTVTTNTLDEIIKCAKENTTKTIMFAETGYNLAQFYLNEGIDVVVSEPFPFYIFDGNNQINIFM